MGCLICLQNGRADGVARSGDAVKFQFIGEMPSPLGRVAERERGRVRLPRSGCVPPGHPHPSRLAACHLPQRGRL